MVKADRLSNMPDDVIHKILSSDDMKAVVGTSSLSSRWRSLWTSMPYLNFSSRAFSSKGKFYESVRAVLRKRDNQTRVSSLNLCIDGSSWDKSVNEVLSYAFCHSVEEMTIQCDKKFRLYNFRSKSLRILTLDGVGFNYSVICKSKWELPVLTTLHLIGVTLYDGDDDDDFDNTQNSEVVSEAWNEFFSKCPNLKYLSLDGCRIGGAGFRVGHPHLSNLELANGVWGLTTFTVDTPQLKNLCIINCGSVDLSSAPELTSLIYRHLEEFEFEAECCLPSLEKVDLCIRNPHPDSMNDIVDVLQKFQSVKFLTINAEILELLSSELELISDKPSPFAKLKSLNIYPAIIDDDDEYDYSKDEEYDEYEYEFIYELQYDEEEEDEDKEEEEGEEEEEEEEEEEDEDEGVDEDEDDICAEVKNYFLNGSPSATVTKVTCEEMRAVTTPELVINLMEELQVLLKEEKAKIFMARKKRGKTPMQSHVTELHQQGKTEFMKRTQFLTEERVLTPERRWKDPSVQYYIENRMIRHIVSKLQAIKGVLATFPHTKRGEMKACFGRLFAEANLVMKKVNDAISRNIVEEHAKEQFPQNHEEFDTTSGKWGKVYERQSKRLKVEE